ncbi:MAG: pilus assembly protein [Rhodobacteraceae bacterium]|nr:pilus assembly protein [Paracoccaceae bacterium]
MQTPLRHVLTRFARDTRGSVSVEFVLIMPFLFWAFMATYVFFDGYRQSSVNLKAAYTISDLISRETAGVDEDYISSMYQLLRVMTRTDSGLRMRISVLRFDEEDDRFYVDWSAVRGFTEELTNATVADMKAKLPVMPDEERVILVQTENDFEPIFDVGINTVPLENFVFSRPRFAPQVAWSGS